MRNWVGGGLDQSLEIPRLGPRDCLYCAVVWDSTLGRLGMALASNKDSVARRGGLWKQCTYD